MLIFKLVHLRVMCTTKPQSKQTPKTNVVYFFFVPIGHSDGDASSLAALGRTGRYPNNPYSRVLSFCNELKMEVE